MAWLRRRRSSRGQGMVEFALVIPVFLLLTFGIIELGWLAYANHALTNATKEGARYAMVHGERSGTVATADTVDPIITERAGRFGSRIDITAVEFTPDAEPGSQVRVATTYEHEPIVGLIIGAGGFTLTSESTVIVQY